MLVGCLCVDLCLVRCACPLVCAQGEIFEGFGVEEVRRGYRLLRKRRALNDRVVQVPSVAVKKIKLGGCGGR